MMMSQKTITPVHVKVALNGEYRRFLLNPVTYTNLETTVKKLFNINASVTLKFEDDEKDWVLLTTDAELLYAIELAGSPLRVDVKILAEVPLSVPSPVAEIPPVLCFQGRRGRGGCGGRGGAMNKSEWIAKKESRLSAKLALLKEKLRDSRELTSEQERIIRWKISKLQGKLEWVSAKRASLETAGSQEKTCTEVPPQEEKWGRRGGRGCHGRRGMCGGEGWAKPKGACLMKNLPPEVKENFLQRKAAWKAAKESGDMEQIAACKEAFWAAKHEKWAALAALRAQREKVAGEEKEDNFGECLRGGRGCHGRRGMCGGEGWAKPKGACLRKNLPPELKEQFHQTKAAWKAAKESGDEEQIAACREAFWAAKQAKWAALAALRAQRESGEEQETKTGSA